MLSGQFAQSHLLLARYPLVRSKLADPIKRLRMDYDRYLATAMPALTKPSTAKIRRRENSQISAGHHKLTSPGDLP
jgi:hypothetical protein